VWNLSFNCQPERCTIGSMATAATAAVLRDAAPTAGAVNDNAPPSGHETWNLNYHRYYDPAVGRYTQVDPVPAIDPDFPAHPYAYALSNPLRYTDPTGLAVWLC
jgi:RHS repeat-associated protein